ncbi:MAG: hypothetical protein ACFKPT_22410 [Gloeotrichia echinulata GP01]
MSKIVNTILSARSHPLHTHLTPNATREWGQVKAIANEFRYCVDGERL